MTIRRLTRFAVGVLSLAGSVCLRASDEGACPPDPPTTPAALRVAIDPRTGALAPAPAVAPARAPAVRQPALEAVRLPSGAVRVDLKGRYRMAVVAHQDATGAITTACVPGVSPQDSSRAEVAHAE